MADEQAWRQAWAHDNTQRTVRQSKFEHKNSIPWNLLLITNVIDKCLLSRVFTLDDFNLRLIRNGGDLLAGKSSRFTCTDNPLWSLAVAEALPIDTRRSTRHFGGEGGTLYREVANLKETFFFGGCVVLVCSREERKRQTFFFGIVRSGSSDSTTFDRTNCVVSTERERESSTPQPKTGCRSGEERPVDLYWALYGLLLCGHSRKSERALLCRRTDGRASLFPPLSLSRSPNIIKLNGSSPCFQCVGKR